MSKKQKKMNRTYIAVAVIVVIIAVIALQKGGVEQAADGSKDSGVQENKISYAAEDESQPSDASGSKEEQLLYPDLCYAAGGVPRAASEGCRAGEKNIGDVPGFKVPNICCVKQ